MNDHKLNTENRYDIILPTEIIVKENKNTNVQTKEIDFDKNIVIDQKSTIVLAVTFFLIVFVFLAIVGAAVIGFLCSTFFNEMNNKNEKN